MQFRAPAPGATSLLVALALGLAGCGGGGHASPDAGDAGRDSAGDAGEGGGNAVGIVVDTPPGQVATESADGHCDVLEAALAATTRASVAECANPKGLARVILEPGRNYPVRKTVRLAGAAEVGLADGVAGTATISAAPGFAVDPRDASSACLVAVAALRAKISLRDVTLAQDPSLTLSGVCVSKGSVTLRRAHVGGFRAGGLVATCLPASGCDHETDVDQGTTLTVLNSLVDGNHNAGKGGGIASEGSGASVLVAHSAIVNNASDNDGGGVYLGGGWGTDIIQASTISGNVTTGVGGGVLVRFAVGANTYVNIIGSTIAYNRAAGTGGGIQFEPADDLGGSAPSVQDVSVFSSIVAANDSISTLEWNINAAWSPRGLFNCLDGSFIHVVPGEPRPANMGSCVFDVRNPLLGPLTFLGGVGDLPAHPLLAGSPAVDAALGATRDQQRDDWIEDIDGDPPPDWMLFDRVVDGDRDGTPARDLGAIERNDRWQTELLTVRGKGPSSYTAVTIPAGYDRGAGMAYAAAGATGELVTYALPFAEPGRYEVSIGARRDADAGKFQVAIADDPGGPWTALGTEQDGYATSSAFVTLGPFATPLFATAGERLVRVSVTGKNAASAGYRMYLDFIEAKKSTTSCPVGDVAAGGAHSCALLASGGVRCWGGNAGGQLGAGAGPDRPSPPAVDVASGAAAIAAGVSHTCVLSEAGDVRCWGLNTNGQLGDGTTTARATPPADPVLTGVKAIAAGRAHTCAVMSGGGVRCWGLNDNGQLGDGSTSDRLRPPTNDVLTGVKAISAGGLHTCALMSAGGVRCWGGNGSGQLGDGSMSSRSTPPAADVASGMAAVSAGDTHTCALTAAGGVRCWGHNADGELGIGSYDMVSSPPSNDVLAGAKQVVAGNLFTCALTTAGGVRCWGYNSHGEIGDETALAVDRLAPASADVVGGVASLAAGFTHVCARMLSGGVRCWGNNENGQLGDGMAPNLAFLPPTMDIPGFTGTCE